MSRQKDEIVGVEIDAIGREALMTVIDERMEELGLVPGDYDGVAHGLGLGEAWPNYGEITLAQLVVLAAKLRMAITITGIEMCPLELVQAEDHRHG